LINWKKFANTFANIIGTYLIVWIALIILYIFLSDKVPRIQFDGFDVLVLLFTTAYSFYSATKED